MTTDSEEPNVFNVTLHVEAPKGATAQDVANFMMDLEWVGGCRDPENDTMFDSLVIIKGTVKKLSTRKGWAYVKKS